ncbi:hypothetical protein ONS95_005167 [Cadophora gregata]|uniref:uncharacterized protein n=1 Tax=Cadophora gregata TaxID=51156 RepID=UPI0026DC0312|nr:uncharacterized protein ONS95_005167 [Cadophora gregata]KAK0104902.1 hypothetical protein ONS95_005167 [Cadophora gregata]KAK0115019.1 hypothetical protein ONS96_013489 [Cadophora gregata f. sp. sojae]
MTPLSTTNPLYTFKAPRMEKPNLYFKSTPPEIIRSICAHVDSAVLKNLRLVSRHTCLVASGLLFRTVYVKISSREQLRLDVDHWTNLLSQWSCIGSVHHLRVDGILPKEPDDHGKLRQGPIPQWNERCRQEELGRWRNHVAYDFDGKRILDEDHGWRPLARLIAMLPALRDVVFACTNQFSPCLLESLQEIPSSQCRLYLETFHLRSFHDRDVEGYEYQLVTSPHLEGVVTEHYQDAQVALALAPMLRSLCIISRPPPASTDNFVAAPQGLTTPTRSTFPHHQKDMKRRYPLVNLQFCRERFDEKWDELVDLSALRTLRLDYPIEERVINWLAAKALFSSLTELEVPIGSWYEQNTPESYTQDFASFIQSICPLRLLRIYANPITTNIFTAILEQHGATLQHLSLRTWGHIESVRFDVSQVQKISRQCPLLKKLVLKIPRSKGDKAEQGIYTALGSMSQLQHLELELDCQNRTCLRTLPNGEVEIFNNSSWDEFQQQFYPKEGSLIEVNPRNGHVMDMLINCALDANLAEDIFYCISSEKAPGARRLESLQLSINGGGFFGEPNLPFPADVCGVPEVVDRIAKTWMVESGDMGGVKVTELDTGVDWDNGLENGTSIGLHDRIQDVLAVQVEPVFRRLWPGNGNWLDEWHSFPLEGFQRESLQT